MGVYPRVCGGTMCITWNPWFEMGLSPRVRGNPRSGRDWNGEIGSIPACAGEPGTLWRKRSGHWVYPRVCGGTAPLSV